MKRLKIIFLICSTLLSASGWSQVKIAYVNSQTILASYSKAREAQTQIDELNRQWEKELTDKREELQRLQEQLDAQILLLSDAKIAERKREIQNLYNAIQSFQQEKWASGTGEIYRKQDELMVPIITEINAHINKVGNICDLILDTANGNVLYADASVVNLTDDLLNSLQGLSIKTSHNKISAISKIAYINSQSILASYSKAKQAQSQIDELNKQWEKELIDKKNALKELQEQFESQSLLLSESKKAQKQREIQDLYDAIQSFQQEKWASGTGEIYKKQVELMMPVIAEINANINKVGNSVKCDLILDMANRFILYADASVTDLTDDILNSLQGLAIKTNNYQISSVSKIAYINSQNILKARQPQKINNEINQQIETIGKRNIWDLILDNVNNNILYSSTSVVDITDQVIGGFEKVEKPEVTQTDKYYSDNSPPQITILAPDLSNGLRITHNDKKILVKGMAVDESGIYEILVGGTEANITQNGEFWAEVKLAYGENKIIVKATDTRNNHNQETFYIIRQVLTQRGVSSIPQDDSFVIGKYYALIIAEKDYLYIDGLTYPIKDAERIKEVLTEHYIFDEQNVVFLKNPDRKTVIKTLEDLRTKLTENDNLFIFYAGHGYWDEGLQEGYWLPKEASWDDKSGWLTNNDLTNYIRGIKTKHTLLVTDACFSGAIFKVRDIYKPDISVEKTYQMPSRRAITSGAMRAVPDKSVFVEFLIKRLMVNNEKYLYAQKLFMMIKDPVINNSPMNQTPLYGVIWQTGDEGGDFIFIRR